MMVEFKKTMNGTRNRLSYLSNIAKNKKSGFGWVNIGSHYEVFIENEANVRIWEEIVLTRGIPTYIKIHDFLDIIEKELEKR